MNRASFLFYPLYGVSCAISCAICLKSVHTRGIFDSGNGNRMYRKTPWIRVFHRIHGAPQKRKERDSKDLVNSKIRKTSDFHAIFQRVLRSEERPYLLKESHERELTGTNLALRKLRWKTVLKKKREPNGN